MSVVNAAAVMAAMKITSGGSTPTLTYINSATNTAGLTTYDFGNFSIPSDGLVIVGAAGRAIGGTRTISTISIGGTNGTQCVNPSGNNNATGIFVRAVTAGTHNVTVTFSGSMDRGGCFVWLLTNYSSSTPTDTDGINTGSISSQNLTLDFAANGVAVYCGMHGSLEDTVWSAATERFDTGAEVEFSAADKTMVSAVLGNVETVSYATSSVSGWSAASFA